ncbi:hypothetical protein B296_00006287 [Ensete ventricosum]|uniref:Uncharacterized protein n=1 Tax=Ensete ventricosum TaxID=4639 RepID=A0A427B6X6_ENSVE|nr:hypothetical protein B296_00006287 [Ensete ventricosum]
MRARQLGRDRYGRARDETSCLASRNYSKQQPVAAGRGGNERPSWRDVSSSPDCHLPSLSLLNASPSFKQSLDVPEREEGGLGGEKKRRRRKREDSGQQSNFSKMSLFGLGNRFVDRPSSFLFPSLPFPSHLLFSVFACS